MSRAPAVRASASCYGFGPLACGGCGFFGLLGLSACRVRSPHAMIVPAGRPLVGVATCTLTE